MSESIVTLYKHEDLEFYAEMKEKLFSFNMKRPVSRNTLILETDEQAQELQDPRDVDLTRRQGIFPEFRTIQDNLTLHQMNGELKEILKDSNS